MTYITPLPCCYNIHFVVAVNAVIQEIRRDLEGE
jgi:hypothetical protein